MTQFFSDAPDGFSLIKLDGAKVDGVKGGPDLFYRGAEFWRLTASD